MEAKYGFWGVVIAAVITVGGSYLLEIYKTKKEEKEKIEKIKELEKQNHARVNIDNVYMPPINTKIQSAFFTIIQNDSPIVAKNLDIRINFGESTVYECESQPLNIFKKQKDLENGVFEIHVPSLKREEELYIYCLLSNPIFDSILVTGENLISSEKYTFENYKSSLNSILSKNSTTFFEVIGYILAVIFTGYFTLLGIAFLNKKFAHIWN